MTLRDDRDLAQTMMIALLDKDSKQKAILNPKASSLTMKMIFLTERNAILRKRAAAWVIEITLLTD